MPLLNYLSYNLLSTMQRRWSAEVRKLVKNVKSNYEVLTAAISNTKTKAKVDKKWQEIAETLNALEGGT